MAALIENKLLKTDLLSLVVNLQDKMETMKSKLNEKVSNLTEGVQKLNTNFETLKAQLELKYILLGKD